MPKLLVTCRPGFENDLEEELLEYNSNFECRVFEGFVVASSQHEFAPLQNSVKHFCFARQVFIVLEVSGIPPIIPSTTFSFDMVSRILFESPDTNDGRMVWSPLKKFQNQITTHFIKKNLLWKKEVGPKTAPRFHVFLDPKTQKSFYGYSPIQMSENESNGIMRVRFDKEYPSRSALKLAEFFNLMPEFIPKKKSLSAVDLGAAPGGWTAVLLQQGFDVTCVDHGVLAPAIAKSPKIKHIKSNAFSYAPTKKVDLLVCDVVEKPDLVLKILLTWLENDWCNQFVWNLKLPMKKRFQTVKMILDQFSTLCKVKAKHLYHDREEVTVYGMRIDV